MNLTDEDKKLLEDLDLSNIPEEDKQVILDSIDERMSKRFIANLLVSLPEDKRPELEKKIEEIGDEDPQKTIEAIIDLHPDAKKVLEDSAKEIVEELKKKPETMNQNDEKNPNEQNSNDNEAQDANRAPEHLEQKTSAAEELNDKPQAESSVTAEENPATTPNTQIDQAEEKPEPTPETPQAQTSTIPASVSNDYYRP